MNVPIKKPCPISWTATDRCGTSRFCHLCSKKVYNLSNMEPAAAKAIVDRRDAGQEVCVSFIGDRDGNVIFARMAAAATAAALLTSQVALADGAIPTLDPIATEAVTAAAETDAVPRVLEDVSDSNCGNQVVDLLAPVLVEGVTAQPVTVDPYPEEEWIMYDGGI